MAPTNFNGMPVEIRKAPTLLSVCIMYKKQLFRRAALQQGIKVVPEQSLLNGSNLQMGKIDSFLYLRSDEAVITPLSV